MNKKIDSHAKKSFSDMRKFLRNPKVLLGIISLVVIGSSITIAYAGPGHGNIEPVKEQRSEKVLLREVGDTDIDFISQEGLSSFFGEITSTDISLIHSTREGSLASWRVSVGEKVSTGQTLCTLNTSTGVVSIVSNTTGSIASINKNVGDYVVVSDKIGLIIKENPQKIVRFTIPSSWKNIKVGDALDISWKPEFTPGNANITGISSVINEKGGYQAEALISPETVFPIGASIQIIPQNSKKGVFAQRKAIVFDGTTPYIWLVTEDNILRKQEITVGRLLGEYVEILTGMERGFSYITILDSSVVLENGMPISELIKKDEIVESSDNSHDESVPHSH